MAQRRAKGTPKIIAPIVTSKEPMIIGRIPNFPLVGAHFNPAMNSQTPVLRIIGKPSKKIKKVINIKAEIEDKAMIKRVYLINFSLKSIMSRY
jgi:hypothetical protein